MPLNFYKCSILNYNFFTLLFFSTPDFDNSKN